jgi:phosphatidylglycerophosphatase A
MASTQGAKILGQKDPGIIVTDEIVGFLAAYFTARFEMLPLIFWRFYCSLF